MRLLRKKEECLGRLSEEGAFKSMFESSVVVAMKTMGKVRGDSTENTEA